MKNVVVYDIGPDCLDRYTIIIYQNGRINYYGMSDRPLHPQGFNQFVGDSTDINPIQEEEHLGKLIAFDDLPEEVQRAIHDRM